jgi:hypothetical protein
MRSGRQSSIYSRSGSLGSEVAISTSTTCDMVRVLSTHVCAEFLVVHTLGRSWGYFSFVSTGRSARRSFLPQLAHGISTIQSIAEPLLYRHLAFSVRSPYAAKTMTSSRWRAKVASTTRALAVRDKLLTIPWSHDGLSCLDNHWGRVIPLIAQAHNLQAFCIRTGAVASQQLLAALAIRSLRALDVQIDAHATPGLMAMVGDFVTLVELSLRTSLPPKSSVVLLESISPWYLPRLEVLEWHVSAPACSQHDLASYISRCSFPALRQLILDDSVTKVTMPLYRTFLRAHPELDDVGLERQSLMMLSAVQSRRLSFGIIGGHLFESEAGSFARLAHGVREVALTAAPVDDPDYRHFNELLCIVNQALSVSPDCSVQRVVIRHQDAHTIFRWGERGQSSQDQHLVACMLAHAPKFAAIGVDLVDELGMTAPKYTLKL